MALLAIGFGGCASDDGSATDGGTFVPGFERVPVQEVNFVVQAPSPTEMTRTPADPGTTVYEGEDWDAMALIFAYSQLKGVTGTNSGVYVRTITKAEFDALPTWAGNEEIRRLELKLPVGRAYVFGVTFCDGVTGSPLEAINALARSAQFDFTEGTDITTPRVAVEQLSISNAYASGDDVATTTQVQRFLSVATGFYQGRVVKTDGTDKTNDAGTPQLFEIPAAEEVVTELTELPVMTLYRLATKVDVQWDAQSAYTGSTTYQDVKLTHFAYKGNASADAISAAGFDAAKGGGRLFPARYQADVESGLISKATPLGGGQAFKNDSEISQRSGRTYFYLFPDGTAQGTVEFSATWKEKPTGSDGDGTAKEQTITFHFPQPLQQAAWYKVRANIRGYSNTTDYTLSD